MNSTSVKPFERIYDASLLARRGQLYGEITMSDVSYLEALFWTFDAQKGQWADPVTLSLYTGGGALDASLALYDLILEFRQRFPINIVAVGPCMSGGVIVMQAATRRLGYPHSRYMVHELAFLGGNMTLTAQQNEAREAMKLHKIVRDIIFRRSRIDLDKLRKVRGPVDNYYDAARALDVGLIDEIVKPVLPFDPAGAAA